MSGWCSTARRCAQRLAARRGGDARRLDPARSGDRRLSPPSAATAFRSTRSMGRRRRRAAAAGIADPRRGRLGARPRPARALVEAALIADNAGSKPSSRTRRHYDDQGWRQDSFGEAEATMTAEVRRTFQHRRSVQGQEGRAVRGAGRLHPDLLGQASAGLRRRRPPSSRRRASTPSPASRSTTPS